MEDSLETVGEAALAFVEQAIEPKDQSSSNKDSSEFRRVEMLVEVDGRKLEVQAMSGYYP